jgi:flagellar motor switch/type III secretory pathway protein FliN
MAQFRTWLPDGAIEQGARNVPLRQAVADWSGRWFAHGKLAVAADATPAGAIDTRGGRVWESPGGLAMVVAPASDDRLISLMFGAAPDQAELTAGDRDALDACVGACFGDLRTQVGRVFRLDGNSPWRSASSPALDVGRWWTWQVEDDRGLSMALIAAEEALIARWVRNALPPPPAQARLGSIAHALADQQIVVSAAVGRCRMSTSDLAGLALGDVLVLDQSLDQPVSIAVNRRPKAMRCVVHRTDDHLQFVVA